HLNEPAEITIKLKTTTAETIRQRFWPVSGLHKLDALTRILEAETFDAMIIFVRTKTATIELAEKLEARGFSSAPLNGDIQQKQRERTVEQLKNGKLDILVATDVAARGLDVDRISHVVNYDIPYDSEAYVHRIGRTGRAGRHGEAILFVAPREKRLLHAIEKATNKKIEMMELPSTEFINDKRIASFKQRITDTLATEELGLFYQMIEQYQHEHNVPALEIAAALAHQLQGDEPFLLQNKPQRSSQQSRQKENWDKQDKRPSRRERERTGKKESPFRNTQPEEGMERFRLEVGHKHNVKPGNIVGAIANEAGIDSQYIGRINIFDDYSLVDLPEGMPKEIFIDLKKAWVAGQQLNISRTNEGARNKKRQAKTDTADNAKPAGRKDKNKPRGSEKRGKNSGKGRSKPAARAKSGSKKKARNKAQAT
ncbi:MAG: helicase-related protein, partial [Thioalkalispiraceae bacterium]